MWGQGGISEREQPHHARFLSAREIITPVCQLETIDELWLCFTRKKTVFDIPDFIAVDAQLACSSVKYAELLSVGRNLFSEHHRTFVSDIAPSMPGRILRGTHIGAQQRF